MSFKHCWHDNFCCWCDEQNRKGRKNHWSEDGNVIITCQLNKKGMAYAEGFRMNQKGIKKGFIMGNKLD